MTKNAIYDFTVTDNKGNEVKLDLYKGKVLLIVNTATNCGFTPQYNDLDTLYDTYADKGFEILDFPCNQFGAQAKGTDEEIQQFCTLHYNTKFPRFRKIEVNGEKELPSSSRCDRAKALEKQVNERKTMSAYKDRICFI